MSWRDILKSVNYSAAVLDEESKKELLGLDIPEGWKPIAHHMTITLGPLKEDSMYEVGQEVVMPIIAIGRDDRAMAVKVEADGANVKSFPHVTVAINPDGGKPMHSKSIPEENFEKFSGVLRGIVMEIPN
tara:strand:+ start:859 stop:1248 length:390 start_codon:yes stop_codon:yes gene_type:complete